MQLVNWFEIFADPSKSDVNSLKMWNQSTVKFCQKQTYSQLLNDKFHCHHMQLCKELNEDDSEPVFDKFILFNDEV